MFIHVHLNIYLSPTVFQQHFILVLIFVLFKFIHKPLVRTCLPSSQKIKELRLRNAMVELRKIVFWNNILNICRVEWYTLIIARSLYK